MFPRTKWAKLVVMPQLGHGSPVCSKKPHGANPREWWVPNPLGFGESRIAITKTVAHPAAIPNAIRRSTTLARGALIRGAKMAGKLGGTGKSV
jgi:hypothetical protein